jgi:hypothetical protein
VVNHGGFVVKTWLDITANSPAKIFQLFEFFFGAMGLEKGMGRKADFCTAPLTVRP